MTFFEDNPEHDLPSCIFYFSLSKPPDLSSGGNTGKNYLNTVLIMWTREPQDNVIEQDGKMLTIMDHGMSST